MGVDEGRFGKALQIGSQRETPGHKQAAYPTRPRL